MQQLNQEERFVFLTQSLMSVLQPSDVEQSGNMNEVKAANDKSIHVYMIIDPAGEHRNKVAGLLTASFVPMLGIFPEEISEAVVGTSEEPQLMLLDETSNELLGKVLAEDVNAVQILYSCLSLRALSEQLKPQLHIIVEETEQEGFMRYWDPRVFITLASVLDTPERKQAFMGNIRMIGYIDEETPEKFRVSYIHKEHSAVDKNGEEEQETLGIYSMNLNPEVAIAHDLFNHEMVDYVPLATPMVYTAWDVEVFAKRRSQKQIRQMTRLLVTHPVAQENGLEVSDSLVDNVEELVHKANQDYHMDDVDALYQFVLASYILGVGFEKADEGLLVVLKNKEYSHQYKIIEIEKQILKNGSIDNG